jgi:RimJ/RimL family protein N-acetyltransferase
VTHPYWPLTDLRLWIGDVTLRPMSEDDMGPLSERLPDDVELDPTLPTYAGRDRRPARGTTLHQTYWYSLGTWRPESWNLPMLVSVAGTPVGVQTIEAEEFAARRTVDSSSWLVTSVRGRGIGRQMRLAMLALAFDGLGAEAAETTAWHDNVASLAVSRRIGYVDDGVYQHADRGRVDEMRRMRLTRVAWSRRTRADVRIDGLAPCRPFFGLTE